MESSHTTSRHFGLFGRTGRNRQKAEHWVVRMERKESSQSYSSANDDRSSASVVSAPLIKPRVLELIPLDYIVEHQFVIEADKAEEMKREFQLTTDELLFALINPTKQMARPPISQYQVGAVGLGASGRILMGVNIELRGFPLNQSVHGEQFVIANAVRVGEERLGRIAVSAAPCGHCRQFMTELPASSELVIAVAGADPWSSSLPDLLPHQFGPEDLLEEGVGPRLLEPHTYGLSLTSEAEALLADSPPELARRRGRRVHALQP